MRSDPTLTHSVVMSTSMDKFMAARRPNIPPVPPLVRSKLIFNVPSVPSVPSPSKSMQRQEISTVGLLPARLVLSPARPKSSVGIKKTRGDMQRFNYLENYNKSPSKKQSKDILKTFLLFGDQTPLDGIEERFCVQTERATHIRTHKGERFVRNFFESGFTCKTTEKGSCSQVSVLCVLLWKGNTKAPKILRNEVPFSNRRGIRLVVKCLDGSVKIISPDRVVDCSSEKSSASATNDDTDALDRS